MNLNEIKITWKHEDFDFNNTSEENFKKFMKSSSKGLIQLFKSALFIDIILKTIGITLLFTIAFIQPEFTVISAICYTVTGVFILLTAFLIKEFNNTPQKLYGKFNIYQTIQTQINYYDQRFKWVILMISLTSPLIIFVGYIFYFYTKYNFDRILDIEDTIVLSSFIIIGFIINAFAQYKTFNFRLQQLQNVLKEFEQDTYENQIILHALKKRKITVYIFMTLIIVGVILLFILYNH